MRTETITKEIYTFEELDTDAQQTALEWYRSDYPDHEWWRFVYEDAKRIADILGIDIDQIYFSGFWPQGDGACFTGSYEYRKNSLKAVTEHAPKDTELHEIARGLQTIQQKWFYGLTATVRHHGSCCHEHSVNIDVYDSRDGQYTDPYSPAWQDAEETLTDLLRNFMQWIYKRLETEYNWLMSDETCTENIILNQYEFEKDGSIY